MTSHCAVIFPLKQKMTTQGLAIFPYRRYYTLYDIYREISYIIYNIIYIYIYHDIYVIYHILYIIHYISYSIHCMLNIIHYIICGFTASFLFPLTSFSMSIAFSRRHTTLQDNALQCSASHRITIHHSHHSTAHNATIHHTRLHYTTSKYGWWKKLSNALGMHRDI